MHLRPLRVTDVAMVASWLAQEENYKWLDFGSGQQILHPASIAMMIQRDLNCLRLCLDREEGVPVGIAAITGISKTSRSGTLWCVLGEKSYAGKGCMTRAVSLMLDVAFQELGLESVYAWVVEDNIPSLRMLEKNGFREIGRQRRCHFIEGRLRDRILFDLLASEHRTQ